MFPGRSVININYTKWKYITVNISEINKQCDSEPVTRILQICELQVWNELRTSVKASVHDGTEDGHTSAHPLCTYPDDGNAH